MSTPTPQERADAVMDVDLVRAALVAVDWRDFAGDCRVRDAIASAIAEAERAAAAREREACAKVADDHAMLHEAASSECEHDANNEEAFYHGIDAAAGRTIAAAICTRTEEKNDG